ncbi:MAG TPA: hypothetical protein VGL61_04215 [Kofleriaceae bacterium]|jgi:hypothetical protein
MRKRLGTMLIEAGVLSDAALRKALDEQKRWGRSLGQTLVDLKLVSESELVHVLSQQLAVPVVEIDLIDVPLDVIELVPAAFAQAHDLVPFAKELVFLDVAMADPADAVAVHELQTRTRLNIRPYLAGPKAIERALVKYYARGFGRNARRDLSLQVGRGDELELELADDPVPIEPLSQREEELLALQDRVDELEARVAKLETALAATMKA